MALTKEDIRRIVSDLTGDERLRGPKGNDGEKGDRGPRGLKGEPGPRGLVNVGDKAEIRALAARVADLERIVSELVEE